MKAVKTRIWSGVSPDRASNGRARCRSGEKPHEQRRFTASPDRTGSKPSGVHWSEPECSEPLKRHTETGDGLGSDLAARVQQLLAGLVPAQRCRAGADAPGAGAPGLLDAASPGFAEVVSRLSAMTLDRFGRDKQLLEVRIPWLEVMLWFVPEERMRRRSSGTA